MGPQSGAPGLGVGAPGRGEPSPPSPGCPPRPLGGSPIADGGRALLTVPVTSGRPFHPRVRPISASRPGGPGKRGWVGDREKTGRRD